MTTTDDHGETLDNFYAVSLNTDDILTTVTNSGGEVDNSVEEILRIHRRRLSHLFVGIDAEWRPSFSRYKNPTALLQICVGRSCLTIIKLLCIDYRSPNLRGLAAQRMGRPEMRQCGLAALAMEVTEMGKPRRVRMNN